MSVSELKRQLKRTHNACTLLYKIYVWMIHCNCNLLHVYATILHLGGLKIPFVFQKVKGFRPLTFPHFADHIWPAVTSGKVTWFSREPTSKRCQKLIVWSQQLRLWMYILDNVPSCARIGSNSKMAKLVLAKVSTVVITTLSVPKSTHIQLCCKSMWPCIHWRKINMSS